MVSLGDPDPVTGQVHVAVMTGMTNPDGHTKQASEYGIPSNGHVRQSYHTIHRDNLEYPPDKDSWQKLKDHQMKDTELMKLKLDTEGNKPSGAELEKLKADTTSNSNSYKHNVNALADKLIIGGDLRLYSDQRSHRIKHNLCLHCGEFGHKARECNTQAGSSTSNPSNKSKVNNLADKLGPDGKLTSAERKRRIKKKLCLYCGEPGHKVSNCNKRGNS
jgi:hypothetical protein